jgi:hypothetical protein
MMIAPGVASGRRVVAPLTEWLASGVEVSSSAAVVVGREGGGTRLQLTVELAARGTAEAVVAWPGGPRRVVAYSKCTQLYSVLLCSEKCNIIQNHKDNIKNEAVPTNKTRPRALSLRTMPGVRHRLPRWMGGLTAMLRSL